jgi:asparagine synthase (glutamine-hydrolysing)
MCGFVGILNMQPSAPMHARLDAALAAIRHRGPDGDGKYVAGRFGLAHARLSIIDLSDAASQPMCDRTGRYVLVFNGEIYNFRELARKFFEHDPLLNGHSDTAVLLAMYVRFGRECLKYLDGMFSFVVVDLVSHSVFMARDRFGEKPLYWVRTTDCLAFGSELRALKKLVPDGDWNIDRRSLLLFHGIGSIPAPYTIYCGARAVPAASWIEFAADGSCEEGRYWRLGDDCRSETGTGSAVDACRHLLLGAVESRLVSDVPVGIFLSGGLDSASLMSLTRSLGVPVPESLCIDFDEPPFSEYHLARETAARFGSTLHRYLITAKDFFEGLPGFFAAADQPTTDGYNTYFLAMHARHTGLKVWLSGVGGDELFGGYPSFRLLGRRSRLSRLLQSLRLESLCELLQWIAPHEYRLGRMLQLSRKGPIAIRAYQSLRNTLPVTIANAFLSPGYRLDIDEAFNLIDSIYPDVDRYNDDFQRASALESGVYMASQLLRDIDNFSMAHSIEVRAPFLHHRLFDAVFGLPKQRKIADDRAKPLLLDALIDPLPNAVATQPKRGFTFPTQVWLQDRLDRSLESTVLHRDLDAFWNMGAVVKLWQLYRAGRIHWSIPWQFYAFAHWWREHHA